MNSDKITYAKHHIQGDKWEKWGDEGFKHERRKDERHFTALGFQGSVCKIRKGKKKHVKTTFGAAHKTSAKLLSKWWMLTGPGVCLGSRLPRPTACTRCPWVLWRREWLVKFQVSDACVWSGFPYRKLHPCKMNPVARPCVSKIIPSGTFHTSPWKSNLLTLRGQMQLHVPPT